MIMSKITSAILTPVVIGSAVGVLALGATGFGLVKWSGSKRGLKFMKKMAISMRNKANETIEKLDSAAEKLNEAAHKVQVH